MKNFIVEHKVTKERWYVIDKVKDANIDYYTLANKETGLIISENALKLGQHYKYISVI